MAKGRGGGGGADGVVCVCVGGGLKLLRTDLYMCVKEITCSHRKQSLSLRIHSWLISTVSMGASNKYLMENESNAIHWSGSEFTSSFVLLILHDVFIMILFYTLREKIRFCKSTFQGHGSQL